MSGCVQLTNSAMCPSYSQNYINPANLTSAWSFFSNVTDVSSFDASFNNYLSTQFKRTKYVTQLQCGQTTNYQLQYARTFLCGEFTGISYSRSCYANGAPRIMTSQQTCFQFANSEQVLVNDTTVCTPTSVLSNQSQTYRAGNLTKDFTDCTEWTSLASNSSDAVLGQNNEPNCGFANSTTQLCQYCNPVFGLRDACCIGSNVDLSTCGYTLSSNQVSGTGGSMASSTAPPSTSSSDPSIIAAQSNSSNNSLSGGAIAGIVIGSAVAAALIGLLLLLGFMLARRRKQRARQPLPSPGASSANDARQFPTPNSGSTAVFGNGGGYYGSEAEKAAAMGAGAGYLSAKDAEKQRPLSDGNLSAEAADGRHIVPEHLDQYSGQMITPGATLNVIYPYEAALPDELTLSPNSHVSVARIFDDNWAIGSLDGQEGAFPLVCTTLLNMSARSDDMGDISGRSSSRNSLNSAYAGAQ